MAPSEPPAFRHGEVQPLLPHGMAWTHDKNMAIFFAQRNANKTPIVVSTATSESEILATYSDEKEVVLAYDPGRRFEVEFV